MIPILMPSCIKVEICDANSDSELVARFKTRHEGVPTDTVVSSFSLYGVREGLADSLIYDSIATSKLVVPLNPHQDFSRFILQNGEQSDTLVVNHNREIYLISYTCGFATLFTIENIEYSGEMIKSDTLIKEMVDAENEANEEHIWLFL
jgi:hypothetical protein